jgi:hypothetical protein
VVKRPAAVDGFAEIFALQLVRLGVYLAAPEYVTNKRS